MIDDVLSNGESDSNEGGTGPVGQSHQVYAMMVSRSGSESTHALPRSNIMHHIGTIHRQTMFGSILSSMPSV
jgi:hypothetical protein